MELGIVGLPNAGKSTLFNSLTEAGVPADSYPFCTVDPNVGVVEIEDRRLDKLKEHYQPETCRGAPLKFVDIAGLVAGASRGEGLGNEFLSHIREVDAIVHVVRLFAGGEVAHVEGTIDPLRDVEILESELIIKDLETISRRREKTERMLKTGENKYREEVSYLDHLQEELESGTPVRLMDLNEAEEELVAELFLLTAKPTLFVANLSENKLENRENNEKLLEMRQLAGERGEELVELSATFEEELVELAPEEQELFLEEVGLERRGLERLKRAGYDLLDLITFYTVVGDEVRATPVPAGLTAPEAAGKIHSDMQENFIRAEVINFSTWAEVEDMEAARSEGLVRTEGQDYVIQDGDICYFKF